MNETPEVQAEMAAAPEDLSNVTSIDQPRQPNAQERRRHEKHLERLKRTMNLYKISEEQALKKMQEEDWNDLPVDKKIRRLENLLSNLMREVGNDINNLRSNDGEIATAMDINLRAFSLMLTGECGIKTETQDKYFEEARLEIAAEQRAKQAAQQPQVQTAPDAPSVKEVNTPGSVSVPPEATEFHG